MTKNSSINLSVVNNIDGFSISGNTTGTGGRKFSITSGDVDLIGGATILNGQFLIGDASQNSYIQGNILAGSGMYIQSGAGTLTINSTGGVGGGTTNNYYINSGSGLFLFRSPISNGVDKQFIVSPVNLSYNSFITNTLRNDVDNTIVPYLISGLVNTGFWAVFSNTITNTGYYLDTFACNLSGSGFGLSNVFQLKVTGSEPISTPNLSGIGGTQVIYSGNYILVSGGAGGAGDLSGSRVTDLNTLTNSIQITGTGNITVSVINQTLVVSGYTGDFVLRSETGQFSQSNLQTTGANLYSFITGLSGQDAFNRGGSLYNLDGIQSGTQIVPIWFASYPCVATSVRGFILSGTSATVNALKNNSLTLLAGNINVSTTGAWFSSGILQNNTFNTGDTLSLQFVQNVGNPVSIAVQVDFNRT